MKNSGWECQIDKYADRRNEKSRTAELVLRGVLSSIFSNINHMKQEGRG